MDEKVRTAERNARATPGDELALSRVLVERLRCGTITTERLGLAAYCGSAAARSALGDRWWRFCVDEASLKVEHRDDLTWFDGFEYFRHQAPNRMIVVRAVLAALRATVPPDVLPLLEDFVRVPNEKNRALAEIVAGEYGYGTGVPMVAPPWFQIFMVLEGFTPGRSIERAIGRPDPRSALARARADVERELVAWSLS